jgi:hypothetical protein
MPRGSISGTRDVPEVEPPAEWPNLVPPPSRYESDASLQDEPTEHRRMSRITLHDFLIRLADRVKPE